MGNIALCDQYTDEEFTDIWNQSVSMVDFSKNLGYSSYSGDASQRLRRRVDNLGLDDSHFQRRRPQKRTKENVFCKDSTVDQATLRRWYKNEDIEYVCSICGQKPEWNGKPLTLTLDHINGNNHDDRLENLRWVCPNCDRQLDTFGSKNKTYYAEKTYCLDCGKEISRGAVRCTECAGRAQSKKVIESIISREELKKKIRTQTFESIAKEYGKKSGNTVKKWCKYYNLPYMKKEINQYSDEEWEKI